MAQHFAGENDFLDTDDNALAGLDVTVRTMSIWFNNDAASGTDNLFEDGTAIGGTNGGMLRIRTRASGYRAEFLYGYTTTWGEWYVDDVDLGSGSWHGLAATYDRTDIDENPTVYLDAVQKTVGSGLTEHQTPVGTATTGNDTIRFGGQLNNTADYTGHLAEAGFWNRALSLDELRAVTKGYSPLCFPNGLVTYFPLIRERTDYLNDVSLSVTGTVTVSDHPRIIYPAAPERKGFGGPPSFGNYQYRAKAYG